MKLLTIFTLEGMSIGERTDRFLDWLCLYLAHRFPRRLAYWSFIDTGVRTMNDDEIVPEVYYTELLSRIDK